MRYHIKYNVFEFISEYIAICHSKDFFHYQPHQFLLWHTPLYRWISFGRSLSPGNPKWCSFINELTFKSSRKLSNTIYGIHTDSGIKKMAHGSRSFWVETSKEYFRIHFENSFNRTLPPFSNSSYYESQIYVVLTKYLGRSDSKGQIKYGLARSWLYNIQSYRALIEKFIGGHEFSAADPIKMLHKTSLWGQFVQRDGSLNIERAQRFLESVKLAHNLEEVALSFPLCVLEKKYPIRNVYLAMERS